MEDNINGIQPRLKMTSMEDKEYDNISLPSKPIFSELGPAQPQLVGYFVALDSFLGYIF